MPSIPDRSPFSDVPSHFRRGARKTWHQRRRHNAVLELLRRTKGAVLDYGCGWGDLTFAMAETHAVQGVDVDPRRVAFASEEYAPLCFAICADDHLAFEDGSFDVVTSVVVLHFVPDIDAYFREVRRVLRDKGHLVIAFSNDASTRHRLRRFLGRPAIPFSKGVRWRGDFKEMSDLLTRHGFRIVADSYFFDPPVDNLKNVADMLIGVVEIVLSVLKVRNLASYRVILARKD